VTHPSELLSALLDGELTDGERARIAEHLAICSVCQEELDDLNAARTAARSLLLVEMPPGLVPSGENPAEVLPLTRRPPVWIAAAAAATLALFVGVATILAPPTTLELRLDQLSDQYGARTSMEPAITPRTPVPVLDRVAGPIE
jgi:anti-sigma factor RsiW